MISRRNMALLVVVMLAVSSSAVLTTWLLNEPPDPRRALSLALWRCGCGTVVLAAVMLRSRRIRLSSRQWRRVGLSGVLIGLHFALFLGSLAFTSVASSTTLATLAPVVVALGSVWFLREPPSRRTVVGMAITLVAGIGLGVTDLLAVSGLGAALGDLMAFAATVVMAGSLVIGRAERAAIPAAQYSTVLFGASTATLAVIVAASGAAWMPWAGSEWWAVAGMVVGPQLLGHFLIQTLLSEVSPVLVSTAVLTEPVLASLLALAFLGQVPPTGLLVTAPLVLLGVAIAVTDPHGGVAAGRQPDAPAVMDAPAVVVPPDDGPPVR